MTSKAVLANQIARAVGPSANPGGTPARPTAFRAQGRAPGFLQSADAFSPVVSSYHEWMSGFGVGNPLPRPILDFLSGAFGPLSPITPFAIDQPDQQSGRPEPRRWQYPVGMNLPNYPGNLKLVSFANLRAYADLYSVARTCIQVRKHELAGLDWDIVPTDEAHEAMRGDKAAQKDWQERRNLALAFWRRPDPNYNNFSSWLSACLEDVFVVDALTLYLHPTRMRGKGPFGSDLAALEVLDGTTIYPLVDVTGASPRPPAPAYQQYLWGVPRSDLMTVMLEEDQDAIRDELGDPVQQYRGDQLLYAPYTTRSFTPYGFPPMEQAMLPISIGLRRQQWALDFFTEGSIPGMFVVAPESWTPTQIRQLQDSLNAMGGDVAMKWRVIVLPGGAKPELQKPAEVASAADSQIMESVMMAFDIKPMELGIMPSGGHGLGGRGMHEQGAKESQRHSLKPLAHWWEESVGNYVIQNVWKQQDMQFRFVGLEEQDDQAAKAAVLKTYVTTGLMTLDEARQEIDQEPYGLPETNEPLVLTATGYAPVVGVLEDNEPEPTPPQQPQPPQAGPNGEQQGEQQQEGQPPAKEQPQREGKPAKKPKPAAEPAEEDAAHPAGKSAKATTYDYGSTQLDLSGDIAGSILDLGRSIPDSELADDGREEDPHVTVKYGLKSTHVEAMEILRQLCSHTAPIKLIFGRTTLFKPDDANYEVLVFEVESPELRDLNQKITEQLETVSTQNSYKPHATVAYLKRGEGLKYTSNDRLYGLSATVDHLTVSGEDGQLTRLPLDGEDAQKVITNILIPVWESAAEKSQRAATPYDELDQLRTYLRHGKDPARFHPSLLPPSLVKAVAGRSSAGDRSAFAWARNLLKLAEARDAQLNALMEHLASELGGLSQQLVKGEMLDMTFVDDAVKALGTAYQKALEGGGKAEYDGYELTADDLAIAQKYAVEQRQYLAGLAEDVMAMATSEAGKPALDASQAAKVGNRLDLYASTAHARWEQGRLHGYKAKTGVGEPTITWHSAGDDNVCDNCAALDGQTWTEKEFENDLGGFPGDGDFGQETLCEGAMQCRCFLSYD